MNRFGRSSSSLWYVVILVAVYFTTTRFPAGLWDVASSLAFALLFVVLACSVWAHQSQWIAIDTEHVPINPEGPGMPPEVSAYYRYAVAGLIPLGFKPVLSFSMTNALPNAIGFATVFKNDRTAEVATILNSSVSIGTNTSLLVFRTDFADGTMVTTNNNNSLSYIPTPSPPVHVFAFPQVRDPGRLYEVHQAVVGRFDGGSPRRDPIGDDPNAYVKRSRQREYARFLECGYQYLDETKRVQRLTWKGAFMATLKLIWPVKPVRNVWRWWKAARMLHELDLR